jgi:hypothetical protein
MTSPFAQNAVILNPSDKEYFLRSTKEGAPLDGQVTRTSQVYTGNGGVTIIPNGSNSLHITGPLAGVLTLNCTSRFNFINRLLVVTVAGGVGQNVVINLPAAPYNIALKGSNSTAAAFTLAASANAQSVTIDFRQDGAFITP